MELNETKDLVSNLIKEQGLKEEDAAEAMNASVCDIRSWLDFTNDKVPSKSQVKLLMKNGEKRSLKELIFGIDNPESVTDELEEIQEELTRLDLDGLASRIKTIIQKLNPI